LAAYRGFESTPKGFHAIRRSNPFLSAITPIANYLSGFSRARKCPVRRAFLKKLLTALCRIGVRLLSLGSILSKGHDSAELVRSL